MADNKPSLITGIKEFLLGKSRNPRDSKIFHKLTLVAFFAWVGLGADGLSSSCYGPQEAFLALGNHPYLSIFVAIATALTIFIISSSYSQIVELFPGGGGGYLVASKLLSPSWGMLSGCALIIDYILTITVSVASGADAIFSLLPAPLHSYRLGFAIFIVVVLMVLNMRGAKESIIPLVPIFLIFLITHAYIIFCAFFTHLPNFGVIAAATASDVRSSVSEVGMWGMLILMVRAFSMGAGTFTGIEAVSNGIPILREPRAETAKHTMRYMAISLSFIVLGLMLAYIFYQVKPEPGKTLNAVFFQQATLGWNLNAAATFIFVALISEAMLLFVAAQAGFLDGPRVLSNMAVDHWLPTRFASLSDRLVVQNGILIMSGIVLVIMSLTQGSVRFLVVLYSINVFITFGLSQLGMVRHWWNFRGKVKHWHHKIIVNSVGLALTLLILASMLIFKFNEGGWITLFITGSLVGIAFMIKRHYLATAKLLRRLNSLVVAADAEISGIDEKSIIKPACDFQAKTAVLLVSGFNGLGLHTLFGVIKLFGGTFKNFVFLQIGVVDAGNFKGAHEMESLQTHAKKDIGRYVKFMNKNGFYAQGFIAVGVDVVEEAAKIAPQVLERFPNAIFFGGQLIFPKDSFLTRLLHNYTVFSLQKRLYRHGLPFVILPIKV